MVDRVVRVRIDSRLRVALADLPPGIGEQIGSYLSIPNGAKRKALDLKQWGAEEMPDFIDLWSIDGTDLVMPRGFASILRNGVEAADYTFVWDDRTVAPAIPLRDLIAIGSPNLHPDQERGVQDLLRHRQGILQAPTGAGKTIAALEAWRRTGTTGLVLVEKASLLKQWKASAREHFGVDAGIIGDQSWEEKPLTIAMLQTLRRRLDELDGQRWWQRWGTTIGDEIHHAIADSYMAVFERIVSRNLIGVTATPLDGQWEQRILLALVGPIVSATSQEELRRQGRRVVPRVQIVKTNFRWALTESEEKLRDSRAIYRHIISALQNDSERINLIAEIVAAQPESCAQLIVSKRLEYLDALMTCAVFAGYPDDRIFEMRGSVSLDRREEIAELASEGNCAIFATVADEGVDIPRLDRLHLTWPQRKALTVTQQAGRVLRVHPAKRDVVIFDYCDMQQPVFRSQAYARLQVYRNSGWPIDGLS